jgi:hypothetical protein
VNVVGTPAATVELSQSCRHLSPLPQGAEPTTKTRGSVPACATVEGANTGPGERAVAIPEDGTTVDATAARTTVTAAIAHRDAGMGRSTPGEGGYE